MFGKKVDQAEVLKFGFFGGITQGTYILFVVLLIQYISTNFSDAELGIGGPVLFLSLFVFSAAVSGIFVFGYPIYLAMQKRYAEGLMTALTTLFTLAIIAILLFMFLSLI